jgi:putative ABC transport system ATP-binding protein
MIRAIDLRRTLDTGTQSLDILKGLTFEVAQGESVALTGPSGSGKSTLLSLLAGIDTPTAGQLLIDDINITRMGERELAKIRNEKIGIVFQSFNLIPTLTALENVEMPLYIGRNSAIARQRAVAMLKQVGLENRMKHYPHQLSGGQQQRVAIARALVTQPALLLADEPTGNLDTETGEQILALFTKLRQSLGLTMVIVTHDAHVASHTDRTLHLVDGKFTKTHGAPVKVGAV